MTPAEIQSARLRLGMSQRQFAEALGMGASSERTVRRWESGDRKPGGPTIVAIKALLRQHGIEE